VRIACVGAGPAGLFLAILMKARDPSHEITVLERQRPAGTHGWGVVFWDDLVATLCATDPRTAQEVVDAAYRWVDHVIDIQGRPSLRGRGSGYSIRRDRLLEILSARARDLGIAIDHDREVRDPALLADVDLIVAADGAGSQLRRSAAERFGTRLEAGHNKYVWLGTTGVFEAFTFAFVPTDAGWVWFHAYGFDSEMSTCIVECGPETWAALGFDRLGASASLALLERLFSDPLRGHRLVGPAGDGPLPWLAFRTVTNERWHVDNVALVGDAAHTTHFSIGSGTRLAIEDAVALAAHLEVRRDVETALEAYGRERRRALAEAQAEARRSREWFEHLSRYIDLPPAAFFESLRGRRSPWLPRLPPALYPRLHRVAHHATVLRRLRRSAARGSRGGPSAPR
jgi:anthraniloyl-CoA monooxygenase